MTPSSTEPTPTTPPSSDSGWRKWEPKRVTRPARIALRAIAAGKSYKAAAEEAGLSHEHVIALAQSETGKAEVARLQGLIEKEAVAYLALPPGVAKQTSMANEVDEAVVEAIRELRKIMLESKSDMARAKAATEILKLGNAEKRYQSQATPEDAIELSAEESGVLTTLLGDLRAMDRSTRIDTLEGPPAPDDGFTEPIDSDGQPAPDIDSLDSSKPPEACAP